MKLIEVIIYKIQFHQICSMNLENRFHIKKYDMNIDSASETAALVKATGQFQLCVTFWDILKFHVYQYLFVTIYR